MQFILHFLVRKVIGTEHAIAILNNAIFICYKRQQKLSHSINTLVSTKSMNVANRTFGWTPKVWMWLDMSVQIVADVGDAVGRRAGGVGPAAAAARARTHGARLRGAAAARARPRGSTTLTLRRLYNALEVSSLTRFNVQGLIIVPFLLITMYLSQGLPSCMRQSQRKHLYDRIFTKYGAVR